MLMQSYAKFWLSFYWQSIYSLRLKGLGNFGGKEQTNEQTNNKNLLHECGFSNLKTSHAKKVQDVVKSTPGYLNTLVILNSYLKLAIRRFLEFVCRLRTKLLVNLLTPCLPWMTSNNHQNLEWWYDPCSCSSWHWN